MGMMLIPIEFPAPLSFPNTHLSLLFLQVLQGAEMEHGPFPVGPAHPRAGCSRSLGQLCI